MKIRSAIAFLAAGVLVTGALFVSCQSATSTNDANYAGTGRYVFPVHQSGVIADMSVTTNKSGDVTNVAYSEWQSPGSWVGFTGANTALVGGEYFRLKLPTKYTYFVSVLSGTTVTGWTEFTPGASAPSTTAAPNLDLKMSSLIYAKAYADACIADADPATVLDNAPLATVSIVFGATPVVTVVSKATDTVRTGNMNKANGTSTYFPTSANALGYATNHDRIVDFFTAHPKANFASAATADIAWADYATFTNPAAYTDPATTSAPILAAGHDMVWKVDGVDAVTGATCSDFPNYSLGLQTAYLFAIGDSKGGNARAALIKH
jgi:hypothetical protein